MLNLTPPVWEYTLTVGQVFNLSGRIQSCPTSETCVPKSKWTGLAGSHCCRISLTGIFATLALLFGPLSIVAADEDEDFPPGLEARFSAGESSVRRIDNVLSFDWGGAAPDERLPTGPFTGTWSGTLLARLPGSHRFHAFVAGDVTITIDGKSVLQASSAYGFNSGEPFDLTAGDHAIEVRYTTPAESDKPRARLNVFWSSDAFTMEPVPADVLFRDEGSSQLHATQHGRLLADAFRCAACHRSNDDLSKATQPNGLSVMNAPALDRAKGSQNPIMLIQRLMSPQKAVSNSHMPGFGLSAEEASSVADFLLSVSKDAHKESEIKFKEGDVDAGARLLHSLGCVACHQLPRAQAGAESLADCGAGNRAQNAAEDDHDQCRERSREVVDCVVAQLVQRLGLNKPQGNE